MAKTREQWLSFKNKYTKRMMREQGFTRAGASARFISRFGPFKIWRNK